MFCTASGASSYTHRLLQAVMSSLPPDIGKYVLALTCIGIGYRQALVYVKSS